MTTAKSSFSDSGFLTIYSQYTASEQLPQTGSLYRGFIALREAAELFWRSGVYEESLMIAAAVLLFLNKPYLGCLTMAAAAGFMLLFCADIMAIFMPFLLGCLLTTKFFGNLGSLLNYMPVFVLLFIALVAHFGLYRAPFQKSRMTGPLMAVSAATLLGGLGTIPLREYLAPTSIYYVLGLGPVILIAYTLLLSQFRLRRSYNLLDRFLKTLYIMGFFAAMVIFNTYICRMQEFLETRSAIYMSYRNFCATMLVMALPCSCLRREDGRYHLLGMLLMYLAMLFSGSRTALLFGTAEAAFCVVYMLSRCGAAQRRRVIPFAAALLAVTAAALIPLAKDLFASRLASGEIAGSDESRLAFYLQGVKDFLSAPLFGIGLGNMKNSEIFLGVEGSMVWYHNLIIQIFGSMGLFGASCFGWMYVRRAQLLLRCPGTEKWLMAASVIGLFLVSMVNPGEFCPFPEAILAAAMFAAIEASEEPFEEPSYGRLKRLSRRASVLVYMI